MNIKKIKTTDVFDYVGLACLFVLIFMPQAYVLNLVFWFTGISSLLLKNSIVVIDKSKKIAHRLTILLLAFTAVYLVATVLIIANVPIYIDYRVRNIIRFLMLGGNMLVSKKI